MFLFLVCRSFERLKRELFWIDIVLSGFEVVMLSLVRKFLGVLLSFLVVDSRFFSVWFVCVLLWCFFSVLSGSVVKKGGLMKKVG